MRNARILWKSNRENCFITKINVDTLNFSTTWNLLWMNLLKIRDLLDRHRRHMGGIQSAWSFNPLNCDPKLVINDQKNIGVMFHFHRNTFFPPFEQKSSIFLVAQGVKCLKWKTVRTEHLKKNFNSSGEVQHAIKTKNSVPVSLKRINL